MDLGYFFMIGLYVIIGYMVMLYGCIIGDNLLIGIGSVVFDGIKIGKNCLIGVNIFIF